MTRSVRGYGVSTAVLALLVCAGVAHAQDARGSLVIVGGGPIGGAIDRRFVELAGGPSNAFIVIVPMAAADPAEAGAARVEIFGRLGARAVSLPLTRAAAGSDSVARVLARATGIWFPGGVQSRLADSLAGTPALDSIRSRYRAGAVVGGTSAGAAVLSDPMITGAERRPGGARPVSDSSGQAFMTIDRENVVVAPGFGLLPGVVVDQHFLRRKRHNRLLSLVIEGPNRLGVGIDESTALVVGPDAVWEVIGESQAVVYDARAAVIPSSPGPPGATEIRLHVLAPGMRWDPRTGAAAAR